MKITMELLMKAAKFQQNHKIDADVVEVDDKGEMIKFLEMDDTVVALVDYDNDRNGEKYWIN